VKVGDKALFSSFKVVEVKARTGVPVDDDSSYLEIWASGFIIRGYNQVDLIKARGASSLLDPGDDRH
jgi:hypothetical protein